MEHIINVTAGTADPIAIFASVESADSLTSACEPLSVCAINGAVTVAVIRTVAVILLGVARSPCVVELTFVGGNDDDKDDGDVVIIIGVDDDDDVVLDISVELVRVEVVTFVAEHCLSTIP